MKIEAGGRSPVMIEKFRAENKLIVQLRRGKGGLDRVANGLAIVK